MLAFLACLIVVSLYVLPYYLLSPFPALRGHRDAPATIRARALCSFGSCAAISALLFAVVAARLRFDDGDENDGDHLRGHHHHHHHRHLVEARLAFADPEAWLRASLPLWAVRSAAPALAEALASSLGAGKGAARAWRAAAAEAAEEAARLRLASGGSGGSSSSSFVPSPAAATLRLLGLSPLSAAAPGAVVGAAAICCLLAWPLSQRATEWALGGGAAAGGGGRRVEEEGEGGKQQRRWWWRLGRLKKRGDSGGSGGGSRAPSPSLFLRPLSRLYFPSAATMRDLVIAPLTEEVAFRGCLLPMLLLLLKPSPPTSTTTTTSTKTTTAKALAASSAAFASAHLHHAAAALLLPSSPSVPRAQRRAVALGALLQLGYTFAFGAAAGALLLASGSLAAPVAAHSLANLLGLPRRRRVPRKDGRGSPSSRFLLVRRAEAAVGVLGVAAFALMAAGCSLGGRRGGGRGENVGGGGFAPFSGLASSFGAEASGRRYRSLAAALSLPPASRQ